MTISEYTGKFESMAIEVRCARIIKRHRSSIKIQKYNVAVANLARIIEATLKLSNRQGFHATTLRHISQLSGLSMGGLYSYFDNKNTLLDMILGEVMATASEVLGAPPPGVDQNPVFHMRWLIETHIRLTEDMQPWFVFAFMEAKSFPAAARQVAVESEFATEKLFAIAIRNGVRDKIFKVDDIDLTASLIKPLLQEWYVKRSKYRKRGVRIEKYIAAVTSFVEAVILTRDQ